MADVTITPVDTGRAVSGAANYTTGGVAATTGNNYYIANNGRVLLVVAAATTATLTVSTPNSVDGNAIADLTLALADTNVRVFGPFPPGSYNDSQQRLLVTTSANATIYAVRVP